VESIQQFLKSEEIIMKKLGMSGDDEENEYEEDE
jgi:hypothetical protein